MLLRARRILVGNLLAIKANNKRTVRLFDADALRWFIGVLLDDDDRILGQLGRALPRQLVV